MGTSKLINRGIVVLILLASTNVARADSAVIAWNDVALSSVRSTKLAPPMAARMLAIMHTCMFDAWSRYDAVAIPTQPSSISRRPPSEGILANKQEAVSYAAYRALIDIFSQPAEKLKYDALMAWLGYDPANNSADTDAPAGIGNTCAAAVLAFRHGDGSNQLGDLHPGAYSDYTNYLPAPATDLSSWQPLVVGGTPQKYLVPQWGLVTPFAMTSGSQFRPAPPESPDERGFEIQVNQILQQSATLTDEKKVIAEYWADGGGTNTPPGHWAAIAQSISHRDGYGLDDDVKLFFLQGNAVMDAAIAVWDSKRFYNYVRPITAVHNLGHTKVKAWGGPFQGAQMIFADQWKPYIATPPFPDYTSGHSCFSAASAEVLTRFTGSDYFGGSFTALPGSSLIEPGSTPLGPITLSWNTFYDAAAEAGVSRRYGGIHFLEADVRSREMGIQVAAAVWEKGQRYILGH